MNFKSVRTLITILVGGCILLVVTALVIYSLIANARSQVLVEDQTQELLERNIEARLTAVASAQAELIQGQFEKTLKIAESLAATNAMLGQLDDNGRPALNLSRREISLLVRQTVATNPEILDAYIGWEPNAFGLDARFAGREGLGYGADGRFRPWWYRTENGDLAALPLSDAMESEAIQASGVRSGEYYLCPRETLAPVSLTRRSLITTANSRWSPRSMPLLSLMASFVALRALIIRSTLFNRYLTRPTKRYTAARAK